jgi:hypothetical protein
MWLFNNHMILCGITNGCPSAIESISVKMKMRCVRVHLICCCRRCCCSKNSTCGHVADVEGVLATGFVLGRLSIVLYRGVSHAHWPLVCRSHR